MIPTKIVKIDPQEIKESYIREAAKILAAGGLVVIPTETVYGIAANMLNKEAVDRLYAIKDRAKDKRFSLHIDKKETIEDFAWDIPVSAYKLIDKFWPGPLTIILKAKDKDTIGPSTSLRGDGERPSNALGTSLEFIEGRSRTIGIRMPNNEIALSLISEAKVPLVCPSANISGKPAPNNFEQAIKDLKGLVDFAIDAGNTSLGLESSVVDLTVEPLRILREGAIKKEDIENTVRKKTVLFICTGNSCRSVMAKALLEKKLREQGRRDVEVLSRGIMMLSGLGASAETRELLRSEGIDVSSHNSQKITIDIIKKSDIILVMEKLHETKILELALEVKNRVFLLKEFAKISDNDLDIADPIGKSIGFYEETFKIIKEGIEKISKII